MISVLFLPSHLRAQLAAEALRAYPSECCGLIEGISRGEKVEALALHPARNLATAQNRFEIDPREQFRLMHALRDTERDIVGCYHSHPDGEARPSPRDREGAGEEGFVWLIAAVRSNANVEFGAFAFLSGAFEVLRLNV